MCVYVNVSVLVVYMLINMMLSMQGILVLVVTICSIMCSSFPKPAY